MKFEMSRMGNTAIYVSLFQSHHGYNVQQVYDSHINISIIIVKPRHSILNYKRLFTATKTL
jgi:hypothetical protein